MSLSAAEIRRLTYALREPDSAPAALERLRGCRDRAAVEGIAEMIYAPPSAKLACAAIAALEGCVQPLALDALADALASGHASVRLAAVQALHDRHAYHVDDAVHRLLQSDPSWVVRRAALRLLADRPEPTR